MEYEEYLELSEKTLSDEFHIGGKVQNTLHAVMGISTEIEELLDNYGDGNTMDRINVLEEISDVCWYLAILHREYPTIDRFENIAVKVNRDEPFGCILDLNKSTLKLMDIMKKKIFYNKPIPHDAFNNLVLLVDTDIHWLCDYYDIDIKEVYQVNIDKLKARYGDKFTSDKAINRDLDVERTILEEGDK